MARHFEPLRPYRYFGIPDKYEFAHGVASLCAYDAQNLAFVKEIPIGTFPDCHAVSGDNRYVYIACREGLYMISADTLEVVRVFDTGYVYATNFLPDGETLFVHDVYGGLFVIENANNLEKAHIAARKQFLDTNKIGSMIGGKGAMMADQETYLCLGWEDSRVFTISIKPPYETKVWLDRNPVTYQGDDLVIDRGFNYAYAACYSDRKNGYIAQIDLQRRCISKTFRSGNGTCGMTMTDDKRHIIVSNDNENSITVLALETQDLCKYSCSEGFDKLGVKGYIQGISADSQNRIYVYDCSGTGILVRFSPFIAQPIYEIAYKTGVVQGKCAITKDS
ncbi:MAG: hypothetical protein LBQ88_03260 [Treponema sp.]|jgi:DNA-binding beta-propeller fold protein YncE|nr:hypothetical protein [Treponema sp.]